MLREQVSGHGHLPGPLAVDLSSTCFEYFGEMIHQSQLTTNVAENPSDVLQAANLHVFKGDHIFNCAILSRDLFTGPQSLKQRQSNLPTSS